MSEFRDDETMEAWTIRQIREDERAKVERADHRAQLIRALTAQSFGIGVAITWMADEGKRAAGETKIIYCGYDGYPMLIPPAELAAEILGDE